MEWVGEQGIRQEGGCYLEPAEGGTRLALRISFDLSGGPVGRLVERLAARIVGRNI